MNLKTGCYMGPTSYLSKIDKADSVKHNFFWIRRNGKNEY